jgi:hypothetical protein
MKKPTGMVGFFVVLVICKFPTNTEMIVLCVFPHIQMLSKRLLFVLKPFVKNVSILNLALSMPAAGKVAKGMQGGDSSTTSQTI